MSKYLKQSTTLVQSIYTTVTALSRQCLLFYTVMEKKIYLNSLIFYLLYIRNAYEMCFMGQENLIVLFLPFGLYDAKGC